MLTRAIVAAALMATAGLYARAASAPENAPPRAPLSQLPMTLASWQGHDARRLDDDVLAQLGVDDYINRAYASADGAMLSIYVGYYASQRQGDTIHSPQNCLPGSGWQPIFRDRADMTIDGRTIPVNRFVIQRGMDRQAVFYWYQGRGRVVANEFANKGLLMLDAATLRRTDGGLVRLIAPVRATPESAFATLTSFSAALVPRLSVHLP
jgi:EpsI family protein